jgi:hypothetical protein
VLVSLNMVRTHHDMPPEHLSIIICNMVNSPWIWHRSPGHMIMLNDSLDCVALNCFTKHSNSLQRHCIMLPRNVTFNSITKYGNLLTRHCQFALDMVIVSGDNNNKTYTIYYIPVYYAIDYFMYLPRSTGTSYIDIREKVQTIQVTH